MKKEILFIYNYIVFDNFDATNTIFIDIWIVEKPLIMMVSIRFFYTLKIDLNWDV